MENKLSLTDKTKTINALNKIFIAPSEHINSEDIKEDFMLMDAANIIGVIPKNSEARELLKYFLTIDNQTIIPDNLKNIDYLGADPATVAAEFMLKVLKILVISQESLKINTTEGKPITLENVLFKFYIAPRSSQEVV